MHSLSRAAPRPGIGAAHVDPEELRAEVRQTYTELAKAPGGRFHFHTGRALAAMLGYPESVGSRPDLGSGGGLDCFVAADMVGAHGAVNGVDMTPEMLSRSRNQAAALRFSHLEFRAGILENLPVADGEARARAYRVHGHTFRAVKE